MNGYKFVNDLVTEYGLLEGYRIAGRYLEILDDTPDEEEQRFREQMRAAMSEIDNI